MKPCPLQGACCLAASTAADTSNTNAPPQASRPPCPPSVQALDATKGMLYLHMRNTIHRDLKSPNLLVDSAWRVKVGGAQGRRQWGDTACIVPGVPAAGCALWQQLHPSSPRTEAGAPPDVSPCSAGCRLQSEVRRGCSGLRRPTDGLAGAVLAALAVLAGRGGRGNAALPVRSAAGTHAPSPPVPCWCCSKIVHCPVPIVDGTGSGRSTAANMNPRWLVSERERRRHTQPAQAAELCTHCACLTLARVYVYACHTTDPCAWHDCPS
jgi:hypothetical protein